MNLYIKEEDLTFTVLSTQFVTAWTPSAQLRIQTALHRCWTFRLSVGCWEHECRELHYLDRQGFDRARVVPVGPAPHAVGCGASIRKFISLPRAFRRLHRPGRCASGQSAEIDPGQRQHAPKSERRRQQSATTLHRQHLLQSVARLCQF